MILKPGRMRGGPKGFFKMYTTGDKPLGIDGDIFRFGRTNSCLGVSFVSKTYATSCAEKEREATGQSTRVSVSPS